MPKRGRPKAEFMIMDNTRICPVCQKEFVIPGSDWAYKAYTTKRKQYMIYFCSWKCMRRWENGECEELIGKGRMLSTKKRKIWQALDDGLSTKEICNLLDVTVGSVNYYKSKWVPKGEDDE
jgi:hypothetical protein